MVNWLEETFPNLQGKTYAIASPPETRYNCIAWAAGDSENWWWPGPNEKDEYWPPGVPRSESLPCFIDALASLGYSQCETETLEAGSEKVALFADSSNTPKHAARQLPNGRWTSKLGLLEDIEHDLADLQGEAYGTVVVIMKRQIP
jgi:hypothetical protein